MDLRSGSNDPRVTFPPDLSPDPSVHGTGVNWPDHRQRDPSRRASRTDRLRQTVTWRHSRRSARLVSHHRPILYDKRYRHLTNRRHRNLHNRPAVNDRLPKHCLRASCPRPSPNELLRRMRGRNTVLRSNPRPFRGNRVRSTRGQRQTCPLPRSWNDRSRHRGLSTNTSQRLGKPHRRRRSIRPYGH